MDPLDHKSHGYSNHRSTADEIDALCARLDQHHPLERKVRFLLDIRGYLKLNQLHGSYVEFGCYRAGMLYAAFRVLEPTGQITRFVGLDTFAGEPAPTEDETRMAPTLKTGDFFCNRDEVEAFVSECMPQRTELIPGDFRENEVLKQAEPFAPYSVITIDCNLLSAISRSTEFALRHARPGAVIFIDDYLSNFGDGRPHVPKAISGAAKVAERELLPHQFYPPFAKSFIVL